jgi:hypothetical protein
MVFKTPERRNNTAEGLLRADRPIYTLAWLTTFAEVKADPLGAIWCCPDNYLAATKDTPFDPALRPATTSYRSRRERELLVERTIRKSSLVALS